MNLLRDKRDQEHPTTETHHPVLDEEFEPRQEPEKPVAGAKTKSKNTFGTLLMAALIFILAIVITYFGFYKKKEGATPESKTPISQIDSTRDEEQTGITDSTVGTSSSNVVTGAQGSESSLSVASDFMKMIRDVLGTGRVTAFFIDEGSFSAEIDAESGMAASDAYNSIKASLPAHAELTSSAPRGSSALISGTFAAQSASGSSGLTSSEIDATLRRLADDAGTTVSSLSIDGSAEEQHFVVMRVGGSFDGCSLFVEKLAQQNWSITISKLILMPGAGGDYTFVLRFYM